MTGDDGYGRRQVSFGGGDGVGVTLPPVDPAGVVFDAGGVMPWAGVVVDPGVGERAVQALRAPGGEDGPPVSEGTQVEIVVTLHDLHDGQGQVVRFGAGVATPPGFEGLPAVEHATRVAGRALGTLLDLLPAYAGRYGLPLDEGGLVRHARRELTLCGMFAEDPELASSLLAAVASFASFGGHSGGSAEHTRDLLGRLLDYGALAPLTADPAEWQDRSVESGYPLWQNLRDSRCFTEDPTFAGYWRIDDPGRAADPKGPKTIIPTVPVVVS